MLLAANAQAQPILGDVFDFGTQTGIPGIFSPADERSTFELFGTMIQLDRICVVASTAFQAGNLPDINAQLVFEGATFAIRAIKRDQSAYSLGLKMLNAKPTP